MNEGMVMINNFNMLSRYDDDDDDDGDLLLLPTVEMSR